VCGHGSIPSTPREEEEEGKEEKKRRSKKKSEVHSLAQVALSTSADPGASMNV
jgi:hypothetical protein